MIKAIVIIIVTIPCISFASNQARVSSMRSMDLSHHKIVAMDRRYFIRALENLDPDLLISMYDFNSNDILDVGHSVHKNMRGLVSEVDNAYRKEFPNLTDHQIQPEVIVAWGGSFNVYAGPSPEDDTPQNNLLLIILPKAYSNIEPEVIKSIFAHELSHIYLRHGAYENTQTTRNVYHHKNNILGPPRTFNRELNQTVEKWISLSNIPVANRSEENKTNLSRIEKLINIDGLSRYTTEVEADEYATLVSLSMGVNPLAWVNYFFPLLNGNPKATSRDSCLGLIMSGGEPTYGSIKENHPSLCWRYMHIRNIIQIPNLILKH